MKIETQRDGKLAFISNGYTIAITEEPIKLSVNAQYDSDEKDEPMSFYMNCKILGTRICVIHFTRYELDSIHNPTNDIDQEAVCKEISRELLDIMSNIMKGII